MAVWKTVLALASILSFVFGELSITELSNDQVSNYSSGLIFWLIKILFEDLVNAKWVVELLGRQEERFQRQENEIRSLRESVKQLELKLQQQENVPKFKSVNGQPESCGDLSAAGHALNGFYSVRKNETIQSVFCDFSKAPADPGNFQLK